MNPAKPRSPLWGGSMTRHLKGSGANGKAAATHAPRPDKSAGASALAADLSILAHIGLTGLDTLPSDPKLLIERLKADDAADALVDADEFTRGVRRAVRLGLAFKAKLHRHSGKRWTEWIAEHFQAGYSCYQRYHIAAELQLGLLSRRLLVLSNENQARALAPFRRHEKFWQSVADSFPKGFPAGQELRSRLTHSLGLKPKAASSTPRIKLHRILGRIVAATPAGDDPTVAEALVLVRRAIAVLEKGGVP